MNERQRQGRIMMNVGTTLMALAGSMLLILLLGPAGAIIVGGIGIIVIAKTMLARPEKEKEGDPR